MGWPRAPDLGPHPDPRDGIRFHIFLFQYLQHADIRDALRDAA